MKPDDLLLPIQNVACEAVKQGVIIGRREAFREAAAIARRLGCPPFYDRQVGELIAREIEKHE